MRHMRNCSKVLFFEDVATWSMCEVLSELYFNKTTEEKPPPPESVWMQIHAAYYLHPVHAVTNRSFSYVIDTSDRLVGVQMKVAFDWIKTAPGGNGVTRVTVTSSPSWSPLMSVTLICCPIVTLMAVGPSIHGLWFPESVHRHWQYYNGTVTSQSTATCANIDIKYYRIYNAMVKPF